jgi:hypothetical protein
MPIDHEDSTLTDVAGVDDPTQARAFAVRRGAAAALTLVVLAAVLGLLGVRTGEVSAQEGSWTLTVRYPAIARAGLDTPWEVTVTADEGFGKEVTLAVTGAYFDLFETQGFHPEPADGTRDGSTLYLTFTAPESDTFVVAYDAYIQPASQRGAEATVAVVDGTTPLVEVSYRTRLLP